MILLFTQQFKKEERTNIEEKHIVYIYHRKLSRNGIISPLSHICSRICQDQNWSICCFLFFKAHSLCLVIIPSSINVFNNFISFFFWLWSFLFPDRLSPGSMHLHSMISLILSTVLVCLRCFFWFLFLFFSQPVLTEFVAIRNAFAKQV